jgi:hypothetical protein
VNFLLHTAVPKRLFLSHLMVDARKGATQYFSEKEEISFPLESEVNIACSDVRCAPSIRPFDCPSNSLSLARLFKI